MKLKREVQSYCYLGFTCHVVMSLYHDIVRTTACGVEHTFVIGWVEMRLFASLLNIIHYQICHTQERIIPILGPHRKSSSHCQDRQRDLPDLTDTPSNPGPARTRGQSWCLGRRGQGRGIE